MKNLFLDLPKCKSSMTMTIEADEGDEIEILCPIQNDDNDNKEDQIQNQNNLSFKWIINNDNKLLINGQSMVNQKLSLQFNNQIKMISCQATNQFGQQKQPCLFRVKNHRIKSK